MYIFAVWLYHTGILNKDTIFLWVTIKLNRVLITIDLPCHTHQHFIKWYNHLQHIIKDSNLVLFPIFVFHNDIGCTVIGTPAKLHLGVTLAAHSHCITSINHICIIVTTAFVHTIAMTGTISSFTTLAWLDWPSTFSSSIISSRSSISSLSQPSPNERYLHH